MKNIRESEIIAPFICVILTIFFHFQLIPYGFEWTHGDHATAPLTTDEFLNGNITAFLFRMDYAGTTLQPLRVLWYKVWTLFDLTQFARINAHSAFSYVFCPVLMSLSSYYLIRSYVSKNAALFVGIIMAVGLDFLSSQSGNDAYFAYLTLSSALLVWKRNEDNPFWNLRLSRLFIVGIISGLAAYTSRISLLYVLILFLPWGVFTKAIQDTFSVKKSRNKIERFGWYLFIFFIALWLYLEIFGTNLGTLAGRSIKIHAQPNFNIAIIVFTLLASSVHRSWLQSHFRILFIRSICLGCGLLVGLLPEIIHSISAGKLSSGGSGSFASLADGFKAFGLVPGALREIISASPPARDDFGIISQGSTLLLCAALYALFRAYKNDPKRYQPILLLIGLSVFSFCRIYTYTFANTRYLLPILPALWVALGTFWEYAIHRGKSAIIILVLISGFHSMHQLRTRIEKIEDVKSHPALTQGLEIIDRFKSEDITLVLSDDYWKATNSLTWLADWNIIFHPSSGAGLKTTEGENRLKNARTIGILKTGGDLILDLGPEWTLKEITTVGPYRLGTATKTP